MDYTTIGNLEMPMATTVAAGITIEKSWNWTELACPVCDKHKSKGQVVCQVCYMNILDSRNGAYPDRWSK